MPTNDPRLQLEAIARDEIEPILRRHNVGAVVLLASPEAASWRIVDPSWSTLEHHEAGIIGVRVNTKTTDWLARSEATLHMVGSFRDMAHDVAEMFGRIFRAASAGVARLGGAVDHAPFGGGRARPDPYGGKVE